MKPSPSTLQGNTKQDVWAAMRPEIELNKSRLVQRIRSAGHVIGDWNPTFGNMRRITECKKCRRKFTVKWNYAEITIAACTPNEN